MAVLEHQAEQEAHVREAGDEDCHEAESDDSPGRDGSSCELMRDVEVGPEWRRVRRDGGGRQPAAGEGHGMPTSLTRVAMLRSAT
jgi:hypothetical protein